MKRDATVRLPVSFLRVLKLKKIHLTDIAVVTTVPLTARQIAMTWVESELVLRDFGSHLQ